MHVRRFATRSTSVGRPHAIALTLFLTFAGVACRSSGAAATKDDPTAHRRVTAEDCETWVAHGTEAMMTSISVAFAACPPATREAARMRMAFDPGAIRASGNALCQAHVNAEYTAADAACFMSAADAPAIQSCRFGPMTDPKDTPWESIAGSIRQTCAPSSAHAAAPAPGASGGVTM